MLNTSSIYSSLSSSSYMTPTRSRSARSTALNTGRDCTGADYFSASSADFGYDLFLHGVVNCDSTYNSSSASTGTGQSFFSRCRSNRPFFASSAQTSSGHARQQTVARSHHQWNGGGMFSSITSLNRSSFHEQHQHDDRANNYFDISSQQQRMKAANLLASNLSLGSTIPLNTCPSGAAAVAKSGPTAVNSRPTACEEAINRKLRPKPKQSTVTNLGDHLESENVDNLSHQQLHALHRFRRQKKKGFLSRLRDVVISFTPKARLSIVNRHEIFVRFGKEEKDTLACFDFLDKLPTAENNTEIDEDGRTEWPEPSLLTIEDVLREWQADNVDASPPGADETASLNQTSCDKSPTINASLAAINHAICTATLATTDQVIERISNKECQQVQHNDVNLSPTWALDAAFSAAADENMDRNVNCGQATVLLTGEAISISSLSAKVPTATESDHRASDKAFIENESLCSSTDASNQSPPLGYSTNEVTQKGSNSEQNEPVLTCSVPQSQYSRSNSGGKQSKKKWKQKSKSKQSKQQQANKPR